ncbi:hypothetical protein FQN57_002261 [Myotisia sp. PD_48]|nr:hypothetical protein FQN57_002261 [Myotisia sp. PD_48]
MSSQSLYGIRQPKAEVSKKDASSATTLSFANHLSSLISKESKSTQASSSSDGYTPATSTSRGRSRSSKKPDIFSVHNKGSLKRAAADMSSDNPALQIHKSAKDIGTVDEAILHRSKRKMAEKVRLYEELKKGEYLADSSDEDERAGTEDTRYTALRRADKNSLVNFDQKWVDAESGKYKQGFEDINNEAEWQPDESYQEVLVDYEDEFGRTRRGTKAEAFAAARSQQNISRDQESTGLRAVPSAARPLRPSNIIYGSTIQSHAFNPDENLASKMAHLAAKRDRTPTPPPETHYDAEGEIRTRGTGFYTFSKDETARQQEMDELTQARKQTEREREKSSSKKKEREKAKQERLRKIEELRSKKRADQFLDQLGDTLTSVHDSEGS